MRLGRFLITESDIQGGRAVLTGESYRHAVRVLRLRQGDRLRVFTEVGQEWEGRVALVGRDRLEVELESEYPAERAPRLQLVLAQALGKGEKMDLVVQKGTELGLAGIIPLLTARTVPRPETEAAQRLERWRRIARAACAQSGRRRPPAVHAPETVSELAARCRHFEACLVGWEEADLGLKAAVRALGAPRRVLAVVGPEGGWQPDEVYALRAAGAVPVRLGPRILRTETAGIALAAVLMYELGDLGDYHSE